MIGLLKSHFWFANQYETKNGEWFPYDRQNVKCQIISVKRLFWKKYDL